MALFSMTQDDDYASRKAAIARQEKLAEMLSQMGAQEQAVSTAGGITAPMSPMGALARGLTSFGGSYLSGKAAGDEAAAKKAARDEALTARKSFYTLPDAPGLVMSKAEAGETKVPVTAPAFSIPGSNVENAAVTGYGMMPNAPRTEFGTVPGAARSREDKDRLLDEYDMSDNPYLQSLSQRLRAEGKGKMFEGSKYGNFRLNADNTVSTVRAAATEAGDTTDVAQLLAERNKLAPNDPNRSVYDAAINMKTTRAPGVSISMGDKTDKVLSDLYASDLGDLKTKKNSAQNILSIIKDIREIPVGKVYSGPIADLKTTVGSYLEAIGLGGVDNVKIANSQEYQAKIADLGISKIKGALGVNPTDRDLEYVKMTLPLLTKVPAARARLLDLLEKRANTDIGNYQSATTHYRKYNNLDTWSPPGSKTSSGIPTSGFNEP